MRRFLTLAVVAALSACNSEPAAPAEVDSLGPGATNPTASTDSIPADAGVASDVDYDQPVRLVSMTAGDRACYMTVQADGEPERTDMADFRMCERTDLVGQRVVLTVTPSPIMAESCQGNPECTETETVNLVTGADPAGTSPVGNTDDPSTDSLASEN